MDSYAQFQQCIRQNQPEQALLHLQQHLANNRNHAEGFCQAGILLRDLEKLPESLCAFLEACRINPERYEFHHLLGYAYLNLQNPESAILAFNTAIEKSGDPAVLFDRSLALLMDGRYSEGWKEHECRNRLPRFRGHYNFFPAERRWHGQPFPDQILVIYSEQGFGDDLQFCRYLPIVKALGGTVVFCTWKPLVSIMSSLYGVDKVVEYSPFSYSSLKFHLAAPLMSLPYLFNTTLDSIPNQIPYLSVPPIYRTKWQTLLEPYTMGPGIKKIGLVCAGNQTYQAHRTIPLTMWHSILSLPGLQWFSLQKGDAASAVQELTATCSNLIDLTCHIDDFADTAALLDQLDLLISIDTSVPHLAGALGKPVWLLLPFVSDWRWLLRRSDSPWYPGFRLFRQPLPGQWQPVMDQVSQALSARWA